MKVQDLLTEVTVAMTDGEKLSDIKNYALYIFPHVTGGFDITDFENITVYTNLKSLVNRIKEDFAHMEQDLELEELPINKIVNHESWDEFYSEVWITGSLFNEFKEMMQDLGTDL